MDQYTAVKSDLKSNIGRMTMDEFNKKILVLSRENDHANSEDAAKTGKQVYLIRQLFKVGDTKHTGAIDAKDFHRLKAPKCWRAIKLTD